MPSSCKSQLVWTRHSHKTRCWRFFAKSRFPLTLPFPIPSTLWHAVLGNAWKGAVEGNCLTHSPVIVCYTWITITHHSNVLSLCVCQSLTSFSVGSQTRSWWLFLCETSTGSWRCGDSTEMRSFRWSKGKLQLFSLSFYSSKCLWAAGWQPMFTFSQAPILFISTNIKINKRQRVKKAIPFLTSLIVCPPEWQDGA